MKTGAELLLPYAPMWQYDQYQKLK